MLFKTETKVDVKEENSHNSKRNRRDIRELYNRKSIFTEGKAINKQTNLPRGKQNFKSVVFDFHGVKKKYPDLMAF